ncbi:CRISPR-associated endonuclease Cas2 [Coriobacteriales bacterium OH1046]|nr:CRISPR-associated endonuclease Cas2 [Coriobacteriales bacterium OH1046]
MLLVVVYDVNTGTLAGRHRLRKVAKQCVNYGQRVQNSVFECNVDAAIASQLKRRLLEIINDEEDSLRFYNLGNNFRSKIDSYGTKQGYDSEGFLMI